MAPILPHGEKGEASRTMTKSGVIDMSANQPFGVDKFISPFIPVKLNL